VFNNHQQIGAGRMSVQAERSGFRNLVAVAAGILGTAAIALGLTVWWLRSDAIDDASKDAANLAIVLAEQTTRSVQSIELVLNEVQEHVRRVGATTPDAFRRLLQGADTYELLIERLSHLSNASLIALIDNSGRLVSSTNQWPLPLTDLSEHENFQHFRDKDDKGIYVAKPLVDRFTAEKIVLFSKRISDANNEFVGMISVGVKLSYFQQIYGSIDSLPDQTFVLLRTDGTVILRHPDAKDRAGETMPKVSPWYRLVSQGGGTYRSPGYFDTTARQVAVRPISEYPLVIDVTVSETAALASWRIHAIFIGIGTLLALVCSVFLLKILSNKIKLLVDSEATSFRTARDLERANLTIDAALNNISQGIVMFDSSTRLIVCNGHFLELYGLSSDNVRPGCTFREILELRVAGGSLFAHEVDPYIADVLTRVGRGVEFNKTVKLRDGRIICNVNHPMADGGWVATLEDVTEEKRAEAQIVHAAHHDALTGLPNRIQFAAQLEHALKRVRRGERLAVLYIDLDHLKRVNDTLGHPIGDALLKGVAVRLLGCVRDIDTVARLSGDEFAIIQSPIDRPSDAAALATRIREAIRAPIDLNGHQIVVDTSIGISVAPDDGHELDELLKTADIALYEAKNTGRGTYCFYEAKMTERMQARAKLENDLRGALAKGEFELFYQPLVNLKDNRIIAFEALLRWHHPERGMVSPAEFIPVAEEIGLIIPLGEWVLRTACAEAATWPSDINVSVNVSPLQLNNKGLVNAVVSAIASARIPASRLEIELTESVFFEKTFANIATLKHLHELGVRFVMDDFGTGYSSLSYLLSFPFSKIKIDRSFIAGLSDNKESRAIVRAVAALARNLNMDVTAEGVETDKQLQQVRILECTEMQGFLFSRPLPAAEMHRQFLSGRKNTKSAA
jgi:diguanylate cyclase (GGDEF)-like protein